MPKNNKQTSRSNRRRAPNPYRIPRFGGTTPNSLYAVAFPREMKINMRYTENLLKTPSSGLSVDHVFNLNSIFDPDVTGSGHQPYGRDQWALLYNRYRVDQAVVTIRLTGVASGTLTMLANNSSTAITDPTLAPESPLSTVLPFAANGSPVIRTVTYNLANISGVTRPEYTADDKYSSAMTTSPTEILCLHTCWVDANLGTGTCTFQITIDYYCSLWDLIQISQS